MSRIGMKKAGIVLAVSGPIAVPTLENLEEHKDKNSDEVSSDEAENDPISQGEASPTEVGERWRSSFLGTLTGAKKSKLGVSVSLEDMTARANAKQLAYALKELKEGALEEVNFADIKLVTRDLKKILHEIKKAQKHRSKTKGGDKKVVRTLNLRNCSIDDSMCELLAEIILYLGRVLPEESSLQSINLSNNDITTRGALLLLGALKQNSYITSLSLAGNDIAEGVSRWLSEQISSNQSGAISVSPAAKRASMRDVKKQKKSQSLDSHMSTIPIQEEKNNVDALRLEAERLTAQVQALRLEMKRLEVKKNNMKKKKSTSGKESKDTLKEKEKDDSEELGKIFESGGFHLVDTAQVKIGRRIAGMGGSGASIFEATVDGWTCALKEINDVKFMNKSTITAFEREIKIIASLPSHPNVCRYLFASKKDNTIRLFMTLYHGTLASTIKAKLTSMQRATDPFSQSVASTSSISRLLSVLSPSQSSLVSSDSSSDASWSGSDVSEGPTPRDKVSSPRILSPRSKSVRTPRALSNVDQFYFQPKQVHFYATEIASGLEFLHSNGIIHRDIKCENIFSCLDMEGNIKSLAIGDFDTALNTLANRPTTVCGTTAFMAPEVFRGQDYSQQADVFSYGVVLYRLLTFELPWGRGMTVLNYEEKITRAVEFPARVSQNVAFQPLTQLCLKCLSVDPRERPTAKQVKETLLAMNV
eukprot:TRINITY_DN162_c0_g3_i1.p1 TRINITY_DN162_c0_g3~~TRINITY_DN162_c0_g3_i1.p1  ORF type:complete len:703 (-),score=153.41 TRINITY_DN162_c0_g3_i1:231-2339(-)